MGRPSLALDETLGKAPPLPYFSPTPRPQSVKIVSNVWRTPRMCLWGSHQGEGSFVKVEERALPRSVRPAGLKKAEDQLASPGGGMPRNRLGETPAQFSPLTSNSRVNNLPQSALETHKRGAAVGWRGRDAELARKAAPWRAVPAPKRSLHRGERTSVLSAPAGLPRPSPPTSQLPGAGASPLGAAVLGRWLGRKVRARAGAGVGGGCRSLLRACRRAGRGG